MSDTIKLFSRSPHQPAFSSLQQGIHNCHHQISVGGRLEGLGLEEEIQRIGRTIKELQASVATKQNENDRSQVSLLWDDYECLAIRLGIAARKQLPMTSPAKKPLLVQIPGLPAITKALNSMNPNSHIPKLLKALHPDNVNQRLYFIDENWTFVRPPDGEEERTTTLAHILLDGSLRFSSEQQLPLVQKLFDVKADFTAQDSSGIPASKILFALEPTTAEFDPFRRRLIRENAAQAATLFSPELSDLLTNNKEDIAVELLMHPVDVQEYHLTLACSHLGISASERPEGMRCINMLREALIKKNKRISGATLTECLEHLTVGPCSDRAPANTKKRHQYAQSEQGKAKIAELRTLFQTDTTNFA